jgi:hypothetical protein
LRSAVSGVASDDIPVSGPKVLSVASLITTRTRFWPRKSLARAAVQAFLPALFLSV